MGEGLRNGNFARQLDVLHHHCAMKQTVYHIMPAARCQIDIAFTCRTQTRLILKPLACDDQYSLSDVLGCGLPKVAADHNVCLLVTAAINQLAHAPTVWRPLCTLARLPTSANFYRATLSVVKGECMDGLHGDARPASAVRHPSHSF